ncbi:hypothetical protein TRFO_23218 [Tritrichomonas foetus]|uniref:Uncharacterized protein n=1 Tax=Tritrichomonas foetus TaxID=1144522 RepID=A0A1J4KFI9_9EUKA|nr:hypothetical protein TRFO_23218 [Tritrichomonas foetus]|eukprot:OHT08374.1 hypothetical protein TRFO_23218 [Tritrichomonas foetus]
MDDDDDDYGYEEEIEESPENEIDNNNIIEEKAPSIPEPIPTPTVAAPPPPPPKKQKKQKSEDEDEDAFFSALAAKQSQQPKRQPQIQAAHKKLQLNIARELIDRYYETSFDDATKLPKNASNIKFISKRKNWPGFSPPTFSMKETQKQKFSLALSDYGQRSKAEFSLLQKQMNIDAMVYQLHSNPYNYSLLMGLARYHLFKNEFNEATDFVLRLTLILQQTLPNKFVYGVTKLIDSIDFYDIVAFIARFAFRRGCNDTSTELWKFAISVCEDNDPNCFFLCAAVPALFSNDLEFIQSVIKSERTFRGIPISFIPDWQICEALLLLDENLNKVVNLWPDVFSEDEISDDKMPSQLQRIVIALRRRIKPFLDKEEVQFAIDEAKNKKVDVEAEKKQIYDKWSKFTDDIDVSLIVEEDALPVNAENT